MNNPDYISFDFIDNITDYKNKKIREMNSFSKLKPSKNIYEYFDYRGELMDKFCYDIVNNKRCLWIKKCVVLSILSEYDDMIMNDKDLPDYIKDDVCSFINIQRRILKDIHNL